MNRLLKVFLALGVIGCSAFSALGSAHGSAYDVIPAEASDPAAIQTPDAQQKVMREFRGVKLGMKREAVQAAMGKPESTSDSSDDFKLTGDDTMTVHYDNGEVKAIQLAFLDPKNAPAWKDVVGDAEVNELANGAKTARRTMANEKFWVSIYQSKDGTIVRVTISRI